MERKPKSCDICSMSFFPLVELDLPAFKDRVLAVRLQGLADHFGEEFVDVVSGVRRRSFPERSRGDDVVDA